jgi:SAM-dependent methyltransferase
MKIKEILKPIFELMGLTSQQVVERTRTNLAYKYLRGEGIEIGALHRPLTTNSKNNLKVAYVDRLDTDSIRNTYSELKDLPLAAVDIVDNGEILEKIEDGSLDFIIANHFIEHTENPIGTIRNHLRKLKVNGSLFYAIPNKIKTFDRDRAVTSFDHLVKDDFEGPIVSRFAHHKEWVEKVLKLNESEEISRIIFSNISSQYSIHYHVWDEIALQDFAGRIENLMEIRLLKFHKVRDEFILIFAKRI